MNILVTGASGFIGSALLCRLRKDASHEPFASQTRLDSRADWSRDLTTIEAVIHCAARVHVMRDDSADPLVAFRTTNVEGTLTFARQAAAAGVKRFIFLSSIKVNGEETQPGKPFTPEDLPNPQDAYGISKREAEDGLREIAKTTGMEVVIIRPPLVYGPGVKGNFASLTKLISRGIPLPLGAIANKRSLVALENLIDLIIICISHPAAANQTLLVSDGNDLSTSELIRAIATSLQKPARLIPVPTRLLILIGRLLGKPAITQRLCGSLQVDIKKTTELLNWKPAGIFI